MSKKYNLIPTELYKGLLGAPTRVPTLSTPEPSSDQVYISNAKEQMKSILKKRVNPSLKYLKYQQALRTYKKQRQQLERKPVRVELVQPEPITVEESYLPRRRPGRPKAILVANTSKGTASIVTGEDGEEDAFEPLRFEEEEEEEDDGFKTPPSKLEHASPVPSRPKRDKNLKAREDNIAKTAKELYDLMLTKPTVYNINGKSGTIYKDNFVPYEKSNAKESAVIIARTAAGLSVGTISPPGTKHLRAKVEKDPEAKAILQKLQTGRGLFMFKPQRWSRKK